MSPTEFDLRAALRDGEGDGPDPKSILAAGRARASARRSRIAAISGTVVGVLAVGTTGAILLAHHGSNRPSADAAATHASNPRSVYGAANGTSGNALVPAVTAAGSAASASGQPSDEATGSSDSVTPSCPSSYQANPLVEGTSEPYDPRAALFPKTVTSIVVCGYGNTAAGIDVTPGHLVLTGSDATRLVVSLNGAPATRENRMCPDFRNADDHRLALIGVTATGRTPAVFTTLNTNPCIEQASNGSTARFEWSPPADLLAKLLAVQPR